MRSVRTLVRTEVVDGVYRFIADSQKGVGSDADIIGFAVLPKGERINKMSSFKQFKHKIEEKSSYCTWREEKLEEIDHATT